jgi:hypothetical protein
MSHHKHTVTMVVRGTVWTEKGLSEADASTSVASTDRMSELMLRSDPRNLFAELVSLTVDSTESEEG